MRFIHLIADYGIGDPAFSEVIHRLHALDPAITVQSTAVPSFSTVATGFWIAQHGLHGPAFDGLAIYANTAPRQHDAAALPDNQGEELEYVVLDTGVPVIAVNAGYCLSFVKDRIEEHRGITVPHRGSQFRSRDFYPEAVIAILDGEEEYLGEPVDATTIPDVPENCVAFVDGYGNIKTTIRQSAVSASGETRITINGEAATATYAANTFEVPENELCFAPGSSGGDDPFMEIFYRGSSAAATFDNPEPGQTVEWH